MKSAIIKDLTEQLIPVLSEKEKQQMVAYYTVYEKYAEEFSRKATEDLQDHPVFGKLIRGIPKEVAAANDKLSRALQKDAIINENWGPYIEYQIEQGIAYAKMELDFKSWYEVIVLVKNYISPLLQLEYADGEELLSALNGMNRFMDIAMGIIGEAYLKQKQGIIEEERDKIKILNEALEQKVLERTTELERNIEQLKEYKYFFNNNHDLCGIANMEGHFEFVNANFAKILGYTEKEFCETAFIELIHPDDIPATVQEYEKLKSGALVINFVNRYRKKDGSYLYLDWNATPNPATQKLYCVARDISERKKAEEELLKLQQDYERIFNTVSEGIHGIDNDGNIIFENPAAANMLGWDVNELIGKPAHSTMHHSHADGSVYPKTQCEIHATLHDGILRYVADEVFWRKDGSSFPVAYTSSPMLNKKGEIIGSIVTFRDITKQKNAEKALQNSEEKFRNLINFSPVGITLSSQQGEILETNQTIIDMMGFESKEEFLNTPASELYWDKNGRTQLVELFKKEGIVKNFEVRLKRKNGEVIWCSSHIHPFKLPGGEIALLSTTLDISERKKAEEMLELTQFAVDNFGDAIFWITPDARIFKVNEAACSMLGYDQAELLQFSIPDIDPNYNAELWPNHFAELRQKGSLIFETYQQGKDGQLIPVEVRANYINFDNKEFNCASVRDITKRKKAEGELQAVNIELESFSYSVSHDLRAPLRAINGFAKILYEDYASKLDAEGIGMLNIIRDNSKKMGELIDALLAFSKLGRREISVSEINMTELVATVREEEMRGQSDKTEFIINELPAATGDIVLIKQVWINLVSNAIKYSQHIPKARIEIGSYYKDNLIVYYVKDNGAGFDMQYYDKLFGVFQRLHSQDEFKGTGIGLSIAEKVINRHGGSVWAESKLNEGSCFYFSLPTTNL